MNHSIFTQSVLKMGTEHFSNLYEVIITVGIKPHMDSKRKKNVHSKIFSDKFMTTQLLWNPTPRNLTKKMEIYIPKRTVLDVNNWFIHNNQELEIRIYLTDDQ